MVESLWSPVAAWAARPSDPNDVFVAELVARGAKGGVGLFGVPFDGAVLGRRGARGGPDAIRDHLARLKPWSFGGDVPRRAVRDWGNVALPESDVVAAHAAVVAAASQVVAAGELPLALGGDHSLTFPLVGALGRRVGVINLDAHLDVRDFAGAPNSGTSFGRLLAEGVCPGPNLVAVGIREFANSARYVEKARRAGATIFSAEDWVAEPEVVVDRAIEIASRGVDAVYLSVDLDVLDQAHAPGVSAPTPGGVDSALLFRALRRIGARAPLVGADFMEVAPNLDREGVTARAAAYGVMHLVSALP